MQWLRRAAALLAAGEPEPEVPPAVAEPEEAPAAAAQGFDPGDLGPVTPEAWAFAEDLRRAFDAGLAARARLLGAPRPSRAAA